MVGACPGSSFSASWKYLRAAAKSPFLTHSLPASKSTSKSEEAIRARRQVRAPRAECGAQPRRRGESSALLD
eukprot:5333046-Prymnesium_polylepis.1